MTKFDDHPTVKLLRSQQKSQEQNPPSTISSLLDRDWLRSFCLDLGVDDVGFVSIDQPEIDDQRTNLLQAFPQTKSLISFVCRMNRDNVRNPARSVANVEFHHTGEEVNTIARKIVKELEDRGIRSINPAMGFPMEAQDFLNVGKNIWVVSHKPIAVAAGLGHMGIHRNVIHPKFGNFILLGTVLMDAEVTEYDRPIDYNPCVECKLCVAACPVGRSLRMVTSISQLATLTTIANFWVDLPIGQRMLPKVDRLRTMIAKSVRVTRQPCGKVYPLEPIIKRLIASRPALRVKM